MTPVSGVCTFTGLTPNTQYKVVTTGETAKQDGRGGMTWEAVPPKEASFSTLALTTPAVSFGSNLSVYLGDAAITRALTTNSSGAVTYTSSNPAVATVNAAGQVTFVGLGTATITANQAQNGSYAAATASYQVTISQVPVTPTDSPESITYPTLTITQTSVAFAGGNITDANNPGGFNPSITYIVKASGGAVVAANALTANTSYTYQMQYNTYDGATGLLVTGKLSPAQAFTTLAVVLPPNTAPTAIQMTTQPTLTAGSLTNGQSVGTLSCTDFAPTGSQNDCTYSIASQSTAGAFTISGTSLQVANTGLAAGSYSVTVRATDANGLTRDEVKNITISAVVDVTAPNITSGTSLGSANIGTSSNSSLTFNESLASFTV